jgi:hypothetical protein
MEINALKIFLDSLTSEMAALSDFVQVTVYNLTLPSI